MPRKHAHTSGGFTLLEMALSITIITLFLSAMYGIVSGTIRVATTTASIAHEQQELDSLEDILRSTLRTLPSDSKIHSAGNSQTSFLNIHTQDINGEIEFFTQKKDQPDLQFCFTTNHKTTDAPNILFKNVHSVSWHFWDGRSQTWLNTWDDSSTLPELIKLDLQLAQHPFHHQMCFWIPNAKR